MVLRLAVYDLYQNCKELSNPIRTRIEHYEDVGRFWPYWRHHFASIGYKVLQPFWLSAKIEQISCKLIRMACVRSALC